MLKHKHPIEKMQQFIREENLKHKPNIFYDNIQAEFKNLLSFLMKKYPTTSIATNNNNVVISSEENVIILIIILSLLQKKNLILVFWRIAGI